MSEQKINSLKKEFQEIKTELAIKVNKRDELSSELSGRYKINNVRQAQKREKELEESIIKLEAKRDLLIDKIEKRLEKYKDE